MSSMHVWISLAAAPVPVLSTADQVTGHTSTRLTRLPGIDKNIPLLFTAVKCRIIRVAILISDDKQVIFKYCIEGILKNILHSCDIKYYSQKEGHLKLLCGSSVPPQAHDPLKG